MKSSPFPYRIFVLGALGVALPVLAVACGSTTTEVPADPQVASVVVSPVAATLESGDTVRLQAQPMDGAGAAVSGLSVSWSTSASGVATVSLTGLVTAASAGSATISAQVGGVTGNATVTVTDSTASSQVATVVVSPATVSLEKGDTTTLQAEAFDGTGSPVNGVVASWSSDVTGVATVSTSGLVTAVDAGSATITALIDGVIGDATVTVTDSTASSARTVFFTETFEDTDAASRNWFDTAPFTLSTAEKKNGSSSLEWHWTSGQTTPAFGAARKKFTETESVHVSYWVKYSANWIGSGQNYHPHEFQLLTNLDGDWIGPSETHMTAYIEHNYQSGLRPVMGFQDALNIDQGQIGVDLTGVTENRGVAGCNGSSDGYPDDCYLHAGSGNYRNGKLWVANAYLGDSPGSQYKNDWHFVEAYFQLNSISGGVGQTDGIIRYWIDGNLLIDHDDVLLRTGANADMAFHEIFVGPYIGPGSPADQTVWIDDLTVADGP
jgi:uncharacterized protein YjdB